MDVSWKSVYDLNWDNTVLTGDLPCYFVIGNFDAGGNATGLSGNILEIVDNDGNYGRMPLPKMKTYKLLLTNLICIRTRPYTSFIIEKCM